MSLTQAGVPMARSLHIIVFNEEQRRRLAKRHSYSLMGMRHATHTFSLTEFSHIRSFSEKHTTIPLTSHLHPQFRDVL